jgi:hypothetical protein
MGGEWSASSPGRFTPGERASGTHLAGGQVDPRADMDAVGEGKSLPRPCHELNAGQPARSLVTILTELPPLQQQNIATCINQKTASSSPFSMIKFVTMIYDPKICIFGHILRIVSDLYLVTGEVCLSSYGRH